MNGLEKNENSTLNISLGIKACIKIINNIKSTLGPSSMDKLIQYGKEKTIITNDGATIMNLLKPSHPMEKILIEIAKSQDFEVGDGTTTVCLISAELLNLALKMIEEKIHPRNIIKIFKKSSIIATQILSEFSEDPYRFDQEFFKKILMSCCATTLNSKLISSKRHLFSEIIVNAGLSLKKKFDSNMISVKTLLGGSINDSFFIKGICFKRPFSYAGFEKQIKKHYYPHVLLLNIELEIKSEENEAETRLDRISDYKKIVDAEWSIIYEKLDRIAEIKTKAIFSAQTIGDLATQYFAERGILCGGRLSNDEMIRMSRGTGAQIISSIQNINLASLGKCGILEEKQIGHERFIILLGCSFTTITIILRGGSEKLLEETKRCLNDGIMVVKRVLKNQSIVGGAGAVEMKISSKFRQYAQSLTGKNQLILIKYAQAIEIIPKTICENAGLDSISIMSILRSEHEGSKNSWSGIDVEKGCTFDAFKNYIWEPTLIKINAIQAATEAACIILGIDSCYLNSKKKITR